MALPHVTYQFNNVGTPTNPEVRTNFDDLVKYLNDLATARATTFLAQNNVARSNVTGDGTAYTIQFNSAAYNGNNGYNASTFTFTAPYAGQYAFSAAISYGEINSSHTTQILSIVTSNRTYRVVLQNALCATSTPLSLSIIADMDEGDTAYATLTVSGGTKTVGLSATASDAYFAAQFLN